MGFTAGRVGFSRFAVVGDHSSTVDQSTIDALLEHAYLREAIGTPDAISASLVTGEHLDDTGFTFDKCVFGQSSKLLFALRVDTDKVPPAVKHARVRTLEIAAAAGNPSGFATKAQKREARENADRELQKDLKERKFHRARMIPVCWDLARKQLYCAASSGVAIEQLSFLMRRAFGVSLEPLSAGNLALRLVSPHRLDGAVPAALTRGPRRDDDETPIPSIPWAFGSQQPLDFLGNEFLISLWHAAENGGVIELFNKQEISVAIQDRMDLACAWGLQGTQTIRDAAPTLQEEVQQALASGKWPRRIGLILADRKLQFDLLLQGDQMIVSVAKLPAIEDAESPRDMISTRLEQIDKLATIIDALYLDFLLCRIEGDRWNSRRAEIRAWTDSLDTYP